jgi:orotate phosphoribosyltransferase
MNQREVIQIFQNAGVLLQGHFLLSSGLHSAHYLQCAKVLQHPQACAKLARALAAHFKKQEVTAVIGPALGGIILAYELARALGARALFAEREAGKMCLRRGFSVSKDEKVLIAEDVITTGGSLKELIQLLKIYETKIVGIAALIDRSGKKLPFGKIRFECLKKIKIKTYEPQACPLCKQGLTLVKPGSRK